MRQIIHVNQAVIAGNRKHGTDDPPLIARTYLGAEQAHELDLILPDGTSIGRFVYRPHDPLPCGARLWLSLNTEVCRAVSVKESDHAYRSTDGQHQAPASR